jgi:hypothetical protein
VQQQSEQAQEGHDDDTRHDVDDVRPEHDQHHGRLHHDLHGSDHDRV